MQKSSGWIHYGDELVAAIEGGDGALTATILREMLHLTGWGTAEKVAFRTNFRWITKDDDLKWWTSVPT